MTVYILKNNYQRFWEKKKNNDEIWLGTKNNGDDLFMSQISTDVLSKRRRIYSLHPCSFFHSDLAHSSLVAQPIYSPWLRKRTFEPIWLRSSSSSWKSSLKACSNTDGRISVASSWQPYKKDKFRLKGKTEKMEQWDYHNSY